MHSDRSLAQVPRPRSGVALSANSGSGGWKVVDRTEATQDLELMVGSYGKDPAEFVLHSGKIGGATQLAENGATPLQIHRASRWK